MAYRTPPSTTTETASTAAARSGRDVRRGWGERAPWFARPSIEPRCSTAPQSSRKGTSSTPRIPSFNSFMSFLQQGAELATAPVHEHPDPRRRRPQDACHFLGRVTRVVVQDQGLSLPRSKRAKGAHEIYRLLGHLHRQVGKCLYRQPATPLQLTARDLERRLPDPGIDIAERIASGNGLSEGFRQGLVGHIRVPREEQQGTPQSRCVRPVAALYRPSVFVRASHLLHPLPHTLH